MFEMMFISRPAATGGLASPRAPLIASDPAPLFLWGRFALATDAVRAMANSH
jgi:hypothetical protein